MFPIIVLMLAVIAACGQRSETVRIDNVVVGEMPPAQQVAVGYLSLHNSGDESWILNGIYCDCAESVEVHRTLYSSGVMSMREVRHLTIDPHTRVNFEPRGMHLMFFGVNERFVAGQMLRLRFEFNDRQPIEVEAEVKRL